jgi:hypothetical protein
MAVLSFGMPGIVLAFGLLLALINELSGRKS